MCTPIPSSAFEGHLYCAELISKLFQELASLKLHDNFRLWLTAEAHLKFPTVLLQSSLKVSFEAPPGIKRNLMRTYTTWGLESVSQGNLFRAQALFGLAWFHAICQERRKFIPQVHSGKKKEMTKQKNMHNRQCVPNLYFLPLIAGNIWLQ